MHISYLFLLNIGSIKNFKNVFLLENVVILFIIDIESQ